MVVEVELEVEAHPWVEDEVHQEDEAVSVAVTEVAEAVREDSAAVDEERHEVAEVDSRLEEEGDTECGEGERLRRGSKVGSRDSGFGCRTRVSPRRDTISSMYSYLSRKVQSRFCLRRGMRQKMTSPQH